MHITNSIQKGAALLRLGCALTLPAGTVLASSPLNPGDLVIVKATDTELYRYQPADGTVSPIATVGTYANDVALGDGPDAGKGWVASYVPNTLQQVDLATGTVTPFASGFGFYGLAYHNGRLYATALDDSVRVYDPGTGTLLNTYTYPGTAFLGIRYDGLNDRMVLSDWGTGAIDAMNLNGTFSTLVSGQGLSRPYHVALESSGNILVGNSDGGDLIQRIDVHNGNSVSTVASGGLLNSPVGVAVDAAGHIYAANFGDGNLIRMNSDGSDMANLGSIGAAGGRLYSLVVVPQPATQSDFGFFTSFSTTDTSQFVLNGQGTLSDGSAWLPFISTNRLHLTLNQNSLNGTFSPNDFDNGAAIQGFNASFKLQFGPGSGNAADGLALSFGPNVSQSATWYGEVGAGGTSVAVSFHTYTSNGGPAVDVYLFGAQIAHFPMAKADMVNSQLQDVLIQLNRNSTLNISYRGQVVCTSLYLPGWGPTSGLFAISSRTGGENEETDIANVSLATTLYTAEVAPTVVAPPQAATVPEGSNTTFTAAWDGTGPIALQWLKNGSPLAGETGQTLSLTQVPYADNNARYALSISGPSSTITSPAATLTVVRDTTPPTVVKASADATFTAVIVKFSKPVSDTALLNSNYAIDQGVSVSMATRVDAATVQLATSTMAQGKTYTLTINGVQDLATTPNTIAANTTVQFKTLVFVTGTVIHRKYNNVDDNTGGNPNNLLNDPRFPNAADRQDLLTTVEYPANGVGWDQTADPARNYFEEIDGYFIPPTTGNYVFFIAFADRGWLYLSTDESPANKYQIAGTTGWSDPRSWLASHDYSVTLARSDQNAGTQWPDGNTIALQGGNRYYMLLIHHFPSWAGGCWSAATYKLDTDPDPANGSAPTLTGNVVGAYLDPTGTSITFTSQPQNATSIIGTTATFSVAATGTSLYGGAIFYQWQSAPKGTSTWTDIPGATSATYQTPLLDLTYDGTQYRVVATVPPISQNSAASTVTVQPPPNTVAEYAPAQPLGVFGINGGSFQAGQTFNPTASGQLGEISVLLAQGGSQPTTIFVDFRTTQSGVPTSTVLGTATISGSLLTSTPTLLSADFTLLNLPISAGTEYAFTLRTSPGGGGAYISGDLANGYAADAAFMSQDFGATWGPPGSPNNYDIAFQVSLASAELLPPVVTAQPQTQTVSAGAGVTLTVVASGTGPLSFQWLHDGSPIAGATTATLSLNAVQTSAAGDYFVLISNLAGSVMSSLATLLVMGPASPPGNNGFLATGSMPMARYEHSATLLPNGTILVAGGYNGTALSEAELYDPSSGVFTGTGTLTHPRDAHTATLLPNGQVLITGGEGGFGGTAELYDPATGAFTGTGNMNSVRYYHTATLLLDGKVLLVGGGGATGTSLGSAELYDPAMGAFRSTGSLSTARIHHAATLLANGQVLVTGGLNPASGDAEASAEIYDPATGTFSTTGSLSWGHAWHTATALADGRVLVAGGMISGFSVGGLAEVYDPATGTFSSTGSLNTPRLAHTATRLPDGSVLLTGGGNLYTASAELYLPGSDSFTKLASSLNTARAYHTATLLQNGAVLIAGGYNGTYLASAELWQPSPLVVTTTADTVANDGQTSLREAILYANTLSGSKTIVFNIPTSDPNYSPVTGVYTIAPTSALPVITEPVVIDGTTQAGFDPGARRPVIELNGSNAGVAVGLNIFAGNSTVRGLVVNRFSDVGIFLQAGGSNHIEGNFIGTDATGSLALGNALSGVEISSGSASNVIGGTTVASRNIISGNRQGVQIFGGSNNIVEGNYIGVDASGTAPIANTNWGVDIELNGSGNVIGGTGAGAGNVIAFNGSTGVRVASGVGNTVRGNSIFSNLGLGISLSAGANNQQSCPVWARVRQANGSISMVGGLLSSPNAAFTIDFYGNTQGDPSGYGQGQVYLGSLTVTSDGAGNAPFSLILPLPSSGLQFVTATATDALGNSSAFSQATPIVVDIPPSIAPVANQVTTAGQPITVNFTLSDSQLDPGSLAVVGHSANTAVVPEANVILGGGGGARTVTLTPAPNQTGVTTITLIAYDDLLSASTTFTLTVILRVDSLQPASVIGGGPGFTLTVNGAGFASGAVVLWNGQPRATTRVSGSQIGAAISAADLALGNQNINTAAITVLNPDGTLSNPQAFTIVCANVGAAQSQIAPAGQTATVSTAPATQGQADVTASLDNSSGSQPVSVTAATYTTNPGSGAVFDAGSSYLDLKVSGATASSSLTSHFYYPSTVTGSAEASLTLLYYTGTGWARVLSSGGAAPVKDTTDNLDGTVSGGRLTVKFDDTSTPLITQLTGTAFALAVDTTPPVITVVGANPATVECHTSYTDAGATASDACAGDVTAAIQTNNPVNANAPGTYTVTYTASDPSGNTSMATRTVHVVDTTPPVITVLGANPVTVECHTGYTDAGATASDACAGDVTASIQTRNLVNANAPGTYTVTYTVSDPSGNTQTATRTVKVVDTTAPVLSILQPNPMTIYYGASFVEPGATATDTCAGTVPVYYDTANGANPATLGSAVGAYTIKYYAEDPAGNTAAAQRIVNVIYKPAGISCNGNPGHTILQPINADGSSSFKQGSTVPCKFQVFDANCNSVGTPGLVASFVLVATSGGAPGVNEAVISTTPDTAFRWDPSGQQWIFNLSTKNLAKNTTFYYRINLNDGSNIPFSFGLR